MTPNRRDVVEAVDREQPALLKANTKKTCTQFRQLVAARLHALDSGWGELTKNPGETQGTDGRAVDAVIYRPTQQVVDIIKGAGDGPTPGAPVWQEVPKRSTNHWIVPTLLPPPAVPPPVGPVPTVDDAVAALARRVDELAQRVVLLETRRARFVGTTDRVWGHTHRVDLVEEP